MRIKKFFGLKCLLYQVGSLVILISLLALYPGGIPRREPPSCEAPREPTIYHMSCFGNFKVLLFINYVSLYTGSMQILKPIFNKMEPKYSSWVMTKMWVTNIFFHIKFYLCAVMRKIAKKTLEQV